MSIPGILPPVPMDGDLLVDGGVINNLPVDIARQANPTGTVIASDVASAAAPRAPPGYAHPVSGAKILFRRLVPGLQAPEVPSLMTTLVRSLLVHAAGARDRLIAEGVADLYVLLELPGVTLPDLGMIGPVSQAGYDEAYDTIARWVAALGPTPFSGPAEIGSG